MKKPCSLATTAFSLVEVALALGVAAFCLISVFGLLPLGISTNQASFGQTEAANIASAILTDLRATVLTTPPVDQTTAVYQIVVPGTPSGQMKTLFVREDGTLSGTTGNDADATQLPRYRVTLYFTSAGVGPSASTGNPNATAVRLLITWPALADPRAAAAPSNYSGSFETIAALVRN